MGSGDLELRHRIVLGAIDSALWPVVEQVHHLPDTLLYESRLESLQATIRVRLRDQNPLDSRDGELVEFGYPDEKDQSILAQLRSQFDYPQMTILASIYNSIQMYGTWHFGRDAPLRRSQPADRRGDRLEEDYTNLGMVLNQMGTSPEAKRSIIEGLQELYEGFTNYEAVINSGSVQIYFTEGKRRSIPATRLSDGTLRYLCLLAMLYNPNSLPVICIEEPELGLHPRHRRGSGQAPPRGQRANAGHRYNALGHPHRRSVRYARVDRRVRESRRRDADGTPQARRP